MEDILRLARADAAKGNLDLMEIRINEAIDQVLERFRSQFETKRIRVETGGVDDEIFVYADPEKLTKILRNLIQNAFQYTVPG